MNRGRSLLIAASAVLVVSYAVFIYNNAKTEQREDERERREFEVQEAAENFLDVIGVSEQSKDGEDVTALLLFGDEALKACEISYQINPDDFGTFDPNSLDISACFED